MSVTNPFDFASLSDQVLRQRKHAWNLEQDFNWARGANASLPLLPLDSDAVAFPGVSAEQRLVLSQLIGLLVNSTIAEMENVIEEVKDDGWAKLLKRFPVNPEMWELGELFFEEEAKHSQMFYRYNEKFAQALGIDYADLKQLLPNAFTSPFIKALKLNAYSGGNAFWWAVASVEEVSIKLFQQMREHKDSLDPLYYEVHQKHMEEEARHHNYAFLMLSLIESKSHSLKEKLFFKSDLLFSQLAQTGWVMTEVMKLTRAKKLKSKHPFFEIISSCLPHFMALGPTELIRKLFISAPYVSLMLNTKNHPMTWRVALDQHTLSIPLPEPIEEKLFLHVS